MRTDSFMQESPDRDYFLPAVLTSFLFFAPIAGTCVAALVVGEAFQRKSSASLSVLSNYIGTALIWAAAGLVLWLIGLGCYLFLTLKLDYKRVWFWRLAVASCIVLLFSSTIALALPALLFLVFGRSRLLPASAR